MIRYGTFKRDVLEQTVRSWCQTKAWLNYLNTLGKDIQFNSDTESSLYHVPNFTSCPHVYSAPNFTFSKFKNLISKFHRNLETIIFNENIISSIKDEINHSIRSYSLIMIMRLLSLWWVSQVSPYPPIFGHISNHVL